MPSFKMIRSIWTSHKQNQMVTKERQEKTRSGEPLSSSPPKALMTKMTTMTNHELKHNERSWWENHRWGRTSLPAPRAHVLVTQRKWGASPAAFRERLRDACALSLAPGEGTRVGGLGKVGVRKVRERDTKSLTLLHGLRSIRQAAAGRGRGVAGSTTGETTAINEKPRGCRGHLVSLFAS